MHPEGSSVRTFPRSSPRGPARELAAPGKLTGLEPLRRKSRGACPRARRKHRVLTRTRCSIGSFHSRTGSQDSAASESASTAGPPPGFLIPVALGWDRGVCSLNKFPGGAGAAGDHSLEILFLVS